MTTQTPIHLGWTISWQNSLVIVVSLCAPPGSLVAAVVNGAGGIVANEAEDNISNNVAGVDSWSVITSGDDNDDIAN